MLRAVAADPTRLVGAPTLVESAAVMLARKGGRRDRLTYGMAMAAREPLLFKGTDFAHTDVAAVEY
jgi:uncharacterized protein with PIN domain